MLTSDEGEHGNSDRSATCTAHASTTRSAPAPVTAKPVRRTITDRRQNRPVLGVAAGLLLSGPTHVALPVQLASHHVASTGPVVDVAAPFFWDRQRNERVGGRAYRFELDDPGHGPDMSAWYYLAYVVGGDRVQVYEHNAPTTQGPDSAIAKSENIAWHVATTLLGQTSGIARPGEIPDWARPRTDNVEGSSAGLLYALADLDLLTPGRLAGELRVAATGSILGDGVITAVRHVDAKLAAARLSDPDVFFAPHIPPDSGAVTTVVYHQGERTADRTIGDWLNTAGYEHAGRIAATHPDILALVPIHDIRQALSWLCGRTQRPATCTLADITAATPLPIARPYNPPHTQPVAVTPKNADNTHSPQDIEP